jgi:hypothetical protein
MLILMTYEAEDLNYALRKLCPHLSDQELEEARNKLEAYFETICRIANRPILTNSATDASIEGRIPRDHAP